MSQAVTYWGQAARQDDLDALLALAMVYYCGTGVKKDIPRALEYWNRAAQLGNEEAAVILKKLREKIDSEKP
jgi:TPR repeat protein